MKTANITARKRVILGLASVLGLGLVGFGSKPASAQPDRYYNRNGRYVRRHHSYRTHGYRYYRRDQDADLDGIPNWADHDRDNDGIRNNRDRDEDNDGVRKPARPLSAQPASAVAPRRPVRFDPRGTGKTTGRGLRVPARCRVSVLPEPGLRVG